MKKEQILHNAQLILSDRVQSGTLVLSDGCIKVVDGQNYSGLQGVDCEQDFLMPGLIEMHTDNLEKYCVPRPGIFWPSMSAALIAHDNQIFNAGITTVLDAVALGFTDETNYRTRILDTSVEAVKNAKKKGLVRADHFMHFRCELPSESVVDSFSSYANNRMLRLVSVMDHTPGQRQWSDLSKWRTYHRDKKWTEADAQAEIDRRTELQESYGERNRREILSICKEVGVPAASHDDTLPEHCTEGHREGINISEFPTTLQAARKARELGMSIIMGAPNMVRGESHSGNISSHELAEKDMLDGFSSDYMPISLLHSAFILHQRFGTPLPAAISTVTSNIASMVRLDDRGVLEVGKKADILRVRLEDGLPVVKAIWKDGNLLLNH